MNFADDLKETILKAQSEKAKEEQEGRDFEDTWTRLRQSMILPVFREAAVIFDSVLRHGRAEFTNGSIVLHACWNNRADCFEHSLTFSPEKEKRMVACSSSVHDQEESFSLDALTEEVVQAKIKEFAYAIARGARERGPRIEIF